MRKRYWLVGGYVLLCALAVLVLPGMLPVAAGSGTRGGALLLLGIGFLVGGYGTMIGAGGGFLMVPVLLLLYHLRPAQAAGTSLVVVFLNAVSGTASYARQRRVDYRAGVSFALATLPGAIAGAWFARLFSGRDFQLVFAALLTIVAIVLLARPGGSHEPAAEDDADGDAREDDRWWHVAERRTDRGGVTYVYRYNVVVGMAFSFVVGFLSSVLGIGGGVIHVPVLIQLLGFPTHLATATSHFILAVSTGAGAISHIALGHVLVAPAAFLGIGVVGGAQAGAALSHRIHGPWVVRLLALGMLAVALRLVL